MLTDAAVHAETRLTIATDADVCWRMLTYAAVYTETRLTIAAAAVKAKDAALMDAETRIAALGTYAHVCARMLTYADVC